MYFSINVENNQMKGPQILYYQIIYHIKLI